MLSSLLCSVVLCELVRKWCFLRLRCERNARDGFAVHFCRSATNAMPFSATLPWSAVQVITWVGGSSKLPPASRRTNFSPQFSKFSGCLPQAYFIHHHRIASNHHLPDFSPLLGEKFKCLHWRQDTEQGGGFAQLFVLDSFQPCLLPIFS